MLLADLPRPLIPCVQVFKDTHLRYQESRVLFLFLVKRTMGGVTFQ